MLESAGHDGDASSLESDAEAPAESRKRLQQLDVVSMRALFFSGFAYYAVSHVS